MAVCRIYLFTYNRNELLPRAVKSLIDQTFDDWVCELHNDMPADKFPENLIKNLNDNRFIIKNHAENLGPTKAFNLAFEGCNEKYASILEDDNWWEPSFLEEMIGYMEKNPKIDIGWSNMQIWNEGDNDQWINSNKSIWENTNDKIFNWPNTRQALGALHSNGAMIFRGAKSSDYIIPETSLFNAVELIRERSFNYPIYLCNKVLANYSLTKFTSQSSNSVKWTGTQVMLLASFVNAGENKNSVFKLLLKHYRKSKPAPTAVFFLANYFYIKKINLLFNFTPKDWYYIIKWYCINMKRINELNNYLKQQNETWEFLSKKTKAFSYESLLDSIS